MAPGGDLQELRSWVNQKLMWDPSVGTQPLVDHFLKAWLCGDGRAPAPCDAARAMQRHIDIFTSSFNASISTDAYTREHGLPESEPFTAAYLSPAAVLGALANLRAAAAAVPAQGALPATVVRERLERVEIGSLYIALLRWDEMRAWANESAFPWPVEPTVGAAFDRFARVYTRLGMGHRVGYGPSGPDYGLGAQGHGLKWLNDTVHNTSSAASSV
jgi:hypothetical protein